MLKAGDPAPQFRLPNDEGKQTTLADFGGKHVVLYFFVKALTSG